jgi:hypothetical protein
MAQSVVGCLASPKAVRHLRCGSAMAASMDLAFATGCLNVLANDRQSSECGNLVSVNLVCAAVELTAYRFAVALATLRCREALDRVVKGLVDCSVALDRGFDR